MARVEVVPKLDGRNMTMVLAPDKRAQAARGRSASPRKRPPPTDDAVRDPAARRVRTEATS